jgi:VanZ family protein
MKPRQFVRYWVPVIAWMLVIFSASTDLGSAAQTSRFLIPFLHWIYPAISADGIAAVQFAMRKAAHVTEYAILAMLLLRGIRSRGGATFLRHAAVVFAVVGLYAATDEFHQSFIGSRTASPYDVMIDCAGALLGLLAYRALTLRSAASPALASERLAPRGS